MEIVVRQSGAKKHHGYLHVGNVVLPCALGKNGIVSPGAEGDAATPAGTFPMRRILYRSDRVSAPASGLKHAPIGPADGWCDASDDQNYNRPVRLPYPASAERLMRRDRLYNIVVVLGHNDAPVVPGMGSAIFMHVARHDWGPTLGCIALDPDDLVWLLRRCDHHTHVRVVM